MPEEFYRIERLAPYVFAEVLVPNPSYPIHPYGFTIAGSTPRGVRRGMQNAGEILARCRAEAPA